MDSGSLRSRGIPSMLRTLGDRQATGRLHVRSGDAEADLWLRDGVVYTAQAPEARARLGDRLVGAGALDQTQLDAVLAEQRTLSKPRRIGELLVERGLIDRETLRFYVQEQILDSISATFGWRDGEWRFAEGGQIAEDVPLDMSSENVLMEATRRLEEWETIRDEFGSFHAVVDFSPRKTGAEVALTPDEWSLLIQIDGNATIAQMAERSGYGQFETARIIYGLLVSGVVQVLGEGQAAPSVDRESLLAEFAALDEEADDMFPEPRRVSPGPGDRNPRRTHIPPPSERRGLFERFRKE